MMSKCSKRSSDSATRLRLVVPFILSFEHLDIISLDDKCVDRSTERVVCLELYASGIDHGKLLICVVRESAW